MSTYEASYKSLLQGVSQQIPDQRLDGQLNSQLNMMADPVTGIRRRPGVQLGTAFDWTGCDDSHLFATHTTISGTRCHVLVNTNTGKVRLLDQNFTLLSELDGGTYLQAADIKSIRATTVGNEMFLANTSKIPVVQFDASASPSNAGFIYVVAGAFSKSYNVSVVYDGGIVNLTYTTPSGAGAGDAAAATPEAIATELYNQISGLSLTDVRIVAVGWPDSPGGGKLQFNTGTAASPVWTDVTIGQEISNVNIGANKLRIYHPATNNESMPIQRCRIKFEVKTTAGWQVGQFYTAYLAVYVHQQVGTNFVPLRYFTSQYQGTADATWSVQRDGPYVFISRSGTGLNISSNTGKNYLIVSRNARVDAAGELPARLPNSGDGFVCRVGNTESPQYFRYDHAQTEWNETSAYGSPIGIANAPVSIFWNGSAYVLSSEVFEGRLAGDDNSNATHTWATEGITGMGTYQGRLVLLSGPMVSLSASGKPRRFFRSTVTSVLDNDAIEVGSGTNSSASYEHAIPFQKDLILVSESYQAVIPSGNVLLTPRNATVVPTSGHGVDTTCAPVVAGRTLLYPSPRSANFFGVMEMVPSPYTDSQYVSQDSTMHLPKYMPGRCRVAVSSTVSNLVLMAPTGDRQSLVVHEYVWDGDTKAQQAWSTWTFQYNVAYTYFAIDKIIVAFVKNGIVVLGVMDPKIGILYTDATRMPFLDLFFSASIVDHVITLPSWLSTFDPTAKSKLMVVNASGSLAGELVGSSVDGANLRTVRSYPSGYVRVGIPYKSSFSPTAPKVTDYQQQIIHTGKATLLQFVVVTKNSAEFKISVGDNYGNVSEDSPTPTLYWSSAELELNRGFFANVSTCVIPTRTDMRSTVLSLSTEGAGEMNVTAIEYVGKYHPKIKRR